MEFTVIDECHFTNKENNLIENRRIYSFLLFRRRTTYLIADQPIKLFDHLLELLHIILELLESNP